MSKPRALDPLAAIVCVIALATIVVPVAVCTWGVFS